MREKRVNMLRVPNQRLDLGPGKVAPALHLTQSRLDERGLCFRRAASLRSTVAFRHLHTLDENTLQLEQ